MLITIDTGGTKTLVTAFSRQGKPGEEYRFATPKDTKDYIATLSELLHEHYILKSRQLDAIMIGVPGMVKNNRAVWCQNLKWRNFDIAHQLHHFIPDTPIWLENDANLAGLSETLRLKTQPRNSLYVTISTGIGTGITADGQIDPNMALSEGGHMLIEYDGRLRTWENFASGRSIYETYGKYARDITDPKIWRHIADKISRGFLVLIPVIMPDIVIIGGSIGTYFDRYSEYLERFIRNQLPTHIPMPEFRKAKYPEEAVIYGCYYHGIRKLAQTTTP